MNPVSTSGVEAVFIYILGLWLLQRCTMLLLLCGSAHEQNKTFPSDFPGRL